MAYYRNITASTQIKVGLAKIKGIFVSAASGTPTITVYDEAQGGTTRVVLSTFTPVAATPYMFTGDEDGIQLNAGLYVVIGGTVDCTVFYE
ncbi:MAG TPA: hypothetical protein VIY48_20485 [Candidatus Paceibacterota bacterium]